MRLDSSKIVSKYVAYVRRKQSRNEVPLSPEKWLWHVMDLLKVDELLCEE